MTSSNDNNPTPKPPEPAPNSDAYLITISPEQLEEEADVIELTPITNGKQA